MNKTSLTVTLPDSHISVLIEEALAHGIAFDAALVQAIRLYQTVNVKRRHGLKMAFINAQGVVIPDHVFGLPAFD